jgi:hypothetical protein
MAMSLNMDRRAEDKGSLRDLGFARTSSNAKCHSVWKGVGVSCYHQTKALFF